MRRLRFFISLTILVLCLAGTASAWTLNAEEQDIANRMTTASGQHRVGMAADPILSQVARERATDLAKRKYFDHINPDGHGANYLVRRAGYTLPDWYPADGNNLESIAAGRATAATTWSDWMGSPDHKRHLLGEEDFYAEQTAYGVGYYADPGTPYRFYWVVITAPPSVSFAPLTVSVAGQGSVGEFSGITSRQIGQTYTIIATPSDGWLLAGWSGSWTGAQPSATFTMSAGLDATATFVPNPFLARSGAYSGLIGDSTAEHETRGLLRLKLDGLGQFSGRLFFAGKGYAVLGSFGLDGKAVVKFPRDGLLPLKLKLDLNALSGQIGGKVVDGAAKIPLAIAPARQTETVLATLAGIYTVILPADAAGTDLAVQLGISYGVLSVDAKGRATLAGTLADGTAFSSGGWIADDGRVAFYAPLYNGKGSLSGVLTFSGTPQSDVAGSLRWIKPSSAQAGSFSQAWNSTVRGTGARYISPDPGQTVITLSSTNPNAWIVFGAASLGGAITQTLFVDGNNVVTIAAAALPNIAVKIKVITGVLKGAFTHPATGAVTKFRGVILRKGNVGGGFFLGANESGSVQFVPAE